MEEEINRSIVEDAVRKFYNENGDKISTVHEDVELENEKGSEVEGEEGYEDDDNHNEQQKDYDLL